ncbi:MAG: alpha-amylase family glycosyl hydrolase [Bacteroidia bacterium]|nr:alpha-amylase family glycosyl hydrolase [Bacteroidia bacterium]
MRNAFFLLLFLSASIIASAQDSVDVTFRYTPAGNPSIVHLPGEFNNWANNSGGSINPDPRWTMSKDAEGVWSKTVRLRVGGGGAPGGAYEYKFNEGGSSSGWLADPLNPRSYGSFGNSIIHVRRPTVLHVLPRPGSIVGTATPEVIAEVFASVNGQVDTAASHILVNGVRMAEFGGRFDASTGYLRVTLPVMSDGEHSVVVVAVETGGYETRDSTRFTVRAAPLQWLTRPNPRVLRDSALLTLKATDAGITAVRMIRNGTDTLDGMLSGDTYTARFALEEGDNMFVAFGMKDGAPVAASPLTLRRFVDHTPRAVILYGISSGMVTLNALASDDPDGDSLRFRWISEDDINPLALNIDREGVFCSFPLPSVPGEYYFRLEARDPADNIGIARNYLRVPAGPGEANMPTTPNENPSWVRDAIVYEVFVPAFSSRGDLQGVIDGIPHMRRLGVNTLWLMPIMDNLGGINSFNGGYNIVDFYNVDESIGTLADYDRLVDSCRANGIRLILDITPNHVSGSHPWVEDIRAWKDYSIYRPFIEARRLGGDRGLGQSVLSESGYALYARYSNWTLANLNLEHPETRDAMLDVYRYWLVDRRADGFRLDVYWGPQERYGSATWWRPFREAIKRYKPEVFILGETDGTGPGSEVNYADRGGAMDAGYDWSWYGQMKNTLGNGDVAMLHNRTINYSPDGRYNYHTGPNAHYFRFMENHDEDRVAQIFRSNTERTKPGVVTMFMAPGIPMLYAGQEVGWQGQRDRINFTSPPRPDFLDFYAKLINTRSRFPGLRTAVAHHLEHGTPGVYAFVRPWLNGNTIVVSNYRDIAVSVTINVEERLLTLASPLTQGALLYLNDVLRDSSYAIRAETLAALPFRLDAFASRVLVLSDSAYFPVVTSTKHPPEAAPFAFSLAQTWPNPLPSGRDAVLEYSLDGRSADRYDVVVEIYDMLGRRVFSQAAGERGAGLHSEVLRTGSALHPGSYLYRLVARNLSSGEARSASRILTMTR